MTLVHVGRPSNQEIQARRRVTQARASGRVARRQSLPEYLEKAEVEALIRCAPHQQARLAMLVQWRAGLRVTEALGLEGRDYSLETDRPTLRVREELAKGAMPRVVPVHSELRAAVTLALAYAPKGRTQRLVEAHAATAWRWVQTAYARAAELGAIPEGRTLGTHTLRHSAARHWLASGIPINVVSRWLGHASLQTTLIYLQILPDPLGDMERVP